MKNSWQQLTDIDKLAAIQTVASSKQIDERAVEKHECLVLFVGRIN